MRKRTAHMIIDGIDHKFCKKCDKFHPVSKFNKKNASYDGLEVSCAECTKKKSKKFRDKNPEFDKAYQKKHADKLREYKRQYYLNNKDKKD